MYVSRRVFATLLSVMLAGLVSSSAWAGDGEPQKDCGASCGLGDCGQKGGLCSDCGCRNACCNKVCRLKCEPKKVKVTCYKAECECIPLPPPSHRGCRNCQMVSCDGDKDGDGKCDGKDGCCGTCQKKVVWFDWNLDCGKGGDGESCCRTGHKKKLMMKEIEVELKGAYQYKWEIVDLCKGCEDKSMDKAPDVSPDAEVPPPPPVAARVIYGKPLVERTALRTE